MSDTALLIIDMFNDYRHDDADRLAANVTEILGPLRQLRDAAREHPAVDIVYVNDNHGDFNASGDDIVRSAQRGRYPELIEPLLPADGCGFLTKVRHSVFYATALDYLLQRLGTKTLILAGQVTEQCILYSALDGYLRHFDVVIPSDAVAHIDEYLGTAALEMMRRNMDARVVESSHLLRASDHDAEFFR
ncbi:isochorismatase family cysteine hydrolase [Mycobacterium sp. 852013-50091_SCH5140682]|uniref:isochorismatase family cysteine hydrolase n=1 Tax=Mycobacterium sp. 852013-50091_SCH5140682 TaxID=1834109 RepID=UPI0009EE55E5|nr:isochorismatase family cysteine hydrolase [Mycobacterium sp. 852013-50091_SCH5140682]